VTLQILQIFIIFLKNKEVYDLYLYLINNIQPTNQLKVKNMSVIDKENEQLKLWKKNKAFQKVEEKNRNGKPWYFCDGPPYATGQMHPGTAYNKCAKDSVLRYKRWKGYNVRARAGYDTHGLPIEVKVEKNLGIKHKHDIEKIGVEKFITKCKEFATKHLSKMSSEFIRAGVWMDFDDPYLTYKEDYIESVWDTIKKINEKGFLYRDVSVLPYCTRCETPVANYELEYEMEKSPSIYVKFKIKNQDNAYLIVWTTTPWTLVSNMAVMVHPSKTYVKIKTNGETWVIAKARIDELAQILAINVMVIEEMSGKRLNSIEYEHPLGIRPKVKRKVVLSDEFVSMKEGSGLVHCAPGHGPEDYVIGKRYDLEIFSPVDDLGNFTEDAGKYKGQHVLESNEKIINDLKNKGLLVHRDEIEHRYPHCWRCKTPLIFRTTRQWFAKITNIKSKMIEEINTVTWIPDFARTRFSDFVANAPDWCISRQRYWGIPLPIWVNEENDKDYIVVGSFDELPRKLDDHHRPYIDKIILKNKGKKYKRVADVLDVWIDSGNSVWANLRKNENYDKTQFIIEGKDQIRGWFYSLLGMGVMKNDSAPYETVMMHGFCVDEKGKKMSKSIGNFISFEKIIKQYGADAFRIWSLSAVPWEDMPFSWNNIKEAYGFVNTVDNIAVYLNRFAEDKKDYKISQDELMNIEDRWIISKFNKVLETCEHNYEKYLFHITAREITGFILNDVSRFYMKLVKSRVENNDKICLKILKNIYVESLKILNPIAPFVTERCYHSVVDDAKPTIALEQWPSKKGLTNDVLLSDMGIAQEVISELISARHRTQLKLRWPIDKVMVYTYDNVTLTAVQRLSNVIKSMTNIQTLEIVSKPLGKVKVKYGKGIHETKEFKKIVHDNMQELETKLNAGRSVTINNITISHEHVSIKEKVKDYEVCYFTGGKAYLHTKLPKKVMDEGLAREVIRRIQSVRKELKLIEKDKINVVYSADKDLTKIIERFSAMIIQKVNAKEFKKGKTNPKALKWKVQGLKKEYVFKVNITKI